MNGLLPTEFDDPRNQGLLGAALAMLAASGPSPQKRTFGQILGGAGMQGMQQYDQARVLRQRDEENKRRNALTDMQIQRMREQLNNERQADQFFADPSNFFKMTPPQSAVGDYGPGEAPTVGPQTTSMAPLPQNELALRFIQSRNPQLAKAGAAALMREGEQDKPYQVGKYLVDRNGRVIFSPPDAGSERPPPSSFAEFTLAQQNPAYGQFLKDRRPDPNLIIRDIPGVGTVALNPKTATQVGQPLAPPELKDVPATVKTAVANNESLINSIDDAIKAVESNKQSFGLEYSLGDWFNQRYDPQGVGPRAKVANIGSKKLHDRSGAAVSAREFPRLAPFIPAVNDTPSAVVRKLEEMKRVVEEETGGLKFNYGTDSGYKPFGAQQRSSTQPTNDGRMATEGRMPTPDEIDAELQRRMRR